MSETGCVKECSAAGLLVELRLHLLELVFESGLLVLELSSRFLRGRRQLRVLLLDFNFVYFFLRPALSLRETGALSRRSTDLRSSLKNLKNGRLGTASNNRW